MEPILNSGTNSGYIARKKFSTLTTKAGFGFVTAEQSAVLTAHVSVYPSVAFVGKERLNSLYDRFSFDIGLVQPVGDSGKGSFNDADFRYLVGAGFDLADNFSLQVADVIWFEGGTHHGLYVGVTFNVLSLASNFK